MTTLVIETNRNERFLVNERDEIIRTDMPFEPSGEWLFIGLEGRTAFRNFIRVDTLRYQLARGSLPVLLYKNGNPVFTVRDNDHGTYRSWGGGSPSGKPYGVTRVYLQA